MTDRPTAFIVDDEEIIRHAFESYLNVLNIPVQVFSSANAFLEAFTDDWIGCVFIDVKMPEMNGLELFENLRRRQSSLAAVLMTGNEDDVAMQLARDAGASATLEKPFSVDQLKAMLQLHLTR